MLLEKLGVREEDPILEAAWREVPTRARSRRPEGGGPRSLEDQQLEVLAQVR